jgi:hypothetical protein
MAGKRRAGDREIFPAVLIVWFDGKEFCTLAHDNGDGAIRVYPRDQYDARIDLGRDEPLLYCGSERHARAHMTAAQGRDGACQIPTWLAPAFGFPRSDLDGDALAALVEEPEPERGAFADRK